MDPEDPSAPTGEGGGTSVDAVMKDVNSTGDSAAISPPTGSQAASAAPSSTAAADESKKSAVKGSWKTPLSTNPQEPEKDDEGNLKFYELVVRVTGGTPGNPLASSRVLGWFDKHSPSQVHTLSTKTTHSHHLYFFKEGARDNFQDKKMKLGDYTLHMEAYPPKNNPDFKAAPTVISTKFRLMAVPPTPWPPLKPG